MSEKNIVTVLDPQDEYPHQPDDAPNYNESMYLNGFDAERAVGGWFRLGNRVNERYAEMSVCTYLPGGRVGFTFGRPEIDTNERMDAGGLSIEVVEPFEHLRVRYRGQVCVLDEPRQMADPRRAFSENPWVDCEVDLEHRGISPLYGGKPQYEDGTEIVQDAEQSFYKAHYEQHCAVTGTIRVGDEVIDLDGLGLRDKSWGPRHWQAIGWYRWLPLTFSADFAMVPSVVAGFPTGVVLVGDEYHPIRECTVETEWDDDEYQRALHVTVVTDQRTYEVTGEVLSLIPLRHRRTTPDGRRVVTRITEAMTRYHCDGHVGIGMSEYLDPVDPDTGRVLGGLR